MFNYRFDLKFSFFSDFKMSSTKLKKFNISLIGDPHVGKTTLANMLLNKSFSNEYEPTIGASMLKIPFTQGEETFWFHVFDTAGMEKYRSLAPVYYRDSNLAVIVFDLSETESFDHVQDWLELYRNYAEPGNPVLLIGNKLDMLSDDEENEERKAIFEKANQWSTENKITFMQTSAKNNINVDQILPNVYSLLSEFGLTTRRTKEFQTTQTKQSSGCC